MDKRTCTYCLAPGADACVRVQKPEHGGAHVYAHRSCARARAVPTWYVFLDERSPRPR